jgi:hypothetical protein
MQDGLLDEMLNYVQEFARDFVSWWHDMRSITSESIHKWARLYVYPQIVFGLLFFFWIGTNCMAAWYLYVRILSFIIASRVHRRWPYSKLMGPIMHAPFLILVLISYGWILHRHAPIHSFRLTMQYLYILYTTAITTVALFFDAGILVKWYTGEDVGMYPHSGGETTEYSQVPEQSSLIHGSYQTIQA